MKSGDTLSGIAAKYDLPLYRLFELNQAIRREKLLQPGQRIRLRKPATDSGDARTLATPEPATSRRR